MKRETRILWSLLLLSPGLGELLSGSCPPLRFFNPLTLLALILFYGGGTVLIREARVRWRLQWPILFLAVAYAIWEEGSTVQSFFNPNHPALGALSGYGLYGGIQWPWAIGMVFYHATMSTLVPIAIVDLLWPDSRDVPLLRRRGIVLTILGVLLARMAFVGFMRSQEKLRAHPYQPDPVLVIGSVAIVGLLVYLAHRSRRSVVVTCDAPWLRPLASRSSDSSRREPTSWFPSEWPRPAYLLQPPWQFNSWASSLPWLSSSGRSSIGIERRDTRGRSSPARCRSISPPRRCTNSARRRARNRG